MRVAFAGTPAFARPALEALCRHHQVVGVLTQPDRPRGRGQKLAMSEVKAAALAHGIPLDQPQTLKDAAGRAALASWAPEVLVVVAYGLILPREVLTLPARGCLNIHASLLPRWRGAAPMQRALLAGDSETGITVMQMDEGLDTGAMRLKRALPIGPRDTLGSLHDALAGLGAVAIIEALDALAAGTLPSEPQPAAGVGYAPKVTKAEALIDWTEPAVQIDRRVRAFHPWPVAETRFAGEQLRVHAAIPIDVNGDETVAFGPRSASKTTETGVILAVGDPGIVVQCGQGLIRLTEVQLAGRRAVRARDFARGRALVGTRLG